MLKRGVCPLDEIFFLSATELLHKIRTKQLGIEELTKMYLARIEKYGLKSKLNAVCEINENALSASRQMDSLREPDHRPLRGLPILVKDNIDVSGMHTTAGSCALKDNLATCDAPIIANLRKSGAIILGKSNMTEFANYTSEGIPNGYSSLGGQVKNAYDGKSDPSGSSTGSAVAVSAGLCAAAIGTDTSFSVIACATVHGVVGYKPPHGTLSCQGIIPISRMLDSAGTLTRTLSDALTVYSQLRDVPFPQLHPARPETIRLAVNTYNRDTVSQAQIEKYNSVLDMLRCNGGTVQDISQPYIPQQSDMMKYAFRHDLDDYLAHTTAEHRSLGEILAFYEKNPQYMPYGISTLRNAYRDASGQLDDAPYLLALDMRRTLRAQLLADMRRFDACLMTGPTNIMHFAGLPSVALCHGAGKDHLPRGIILYGVDERRLLSAALTLENYCEPAPFPIHYAQESSP